MANKVFQLQDPDDPKVTTGIDIDMGDRTICCHASIVWFETETVFDDRGPLTLGGYDGCEYCGAMIAEKGNDNV
jgi:hypothetical protein